jgi:hypothetical protein
LGQRHYILGVSWVSQGGKSYDFPMIKLDAPENDDLKGAAYQTYPMHLFVGNHQHMEVITPKEGATSIRCNVKLGRSQASSKGEAKQ